MTDNSEKIRFWINEEAFFTEPGTTVSSLLKTHGFSDTRVIKDLTGKDRVVYGRYQAAYGPDQSVREA